MGLIGFASQIAFAVDDKPLDMSTRWQVVGIISGSEEHGKPFGIAVLKNVTSKRTYTVTVGESLPTDGEFTLEAIRNRKVSVSNGKQSFPLEFATSEVKEVESNSESPRNARFIDSYYRGMENPEAESYGDSANDGSGIELDIRNYPHGSQRFSTFGANNFGTRFELYQPDTKYRRIPGGYGEPIDTATVNGDEQVYDLTQEENEGDEYLDYAPTGDVYSEEDPAIEATRLSQ
jgi:hypothetical protein